MLLSRILPVFPKHPAEMGGQGWGGMSTDLVKVCLHELKDDVDVLEFPWAWWEHDVLDLYDVCIPQKSYI